MPFVLALAWCGLVRLVFGHGHAQWLAGIGVIIGFCVAYVLMEGLPLFPPPASKQKVLYLALAGGLIGLVIDLAHRPPFLERAAAIALPGFALLWLGSRQLAKGPEVSLLVLMVVLWAGSSIVLWRISDQRRDGGLNAALLVMVMAIGVALIAYYGRSASLAMLSGALAAAAGAVALCLYGSRLGLQGVGGFVATAVYGGGGAVVSLVFVLALFTPTAEPWALAILALAPLTGLAARPVHVGHGILDRVLEPVLFAAIAAVPMLAAVGLAAISAEPPSY